MYKVAILYICTGVYDVFWKDFYISCEKNFLRKTDKTYFVFTDSEDLYNKDNKNVNIIYQESLGWPDNTLKRYHMFLRIRKQLENFDFIFFLNANAEIVGEVKEDDFLPIDSEILVVKHPGFYNKNNMDFTYDRNIKSTAYIPYGTGKYYVCGGVNGGKADCFLKMCEVLKENIDQDYAKNIIALWHDESHINKYILSNDNYRILEPEYCYPEEWKLPFDIKILIREKSKWIDVKKVKGQKSKIIEKLCTYFWKRNKND